MRKTIFKGTLKGVDSKLYAIVGSNRYFFSNCKVNIELYEDLFDIPACKSVKTHRISIVICDEVENKDIENVSRFEVKTLIHRFDGNYEEFHLTEIQAVEIDLDGEWRFELTDNEQIKQLFNMM